MVVFVLKKREIRKSPTERLKGNPRNDKRLTQKIMGG